PALPAAFGSVAVKVRLADVLPVFSGNEPFVLANQLNTPVDLILPDQYGYPPLGTSLVVNTQYAQQHPDVITAFVRATIKGAEYMVANKAESVQIVVQYAGTTATRAQHEFQYDVTARDLVSGAAATKG